MRSIVFLRSFFVLVLLLLCAQPVGADSLLETILPKQSKTQPLHGNTESLVYHTPDCKYYNCKHCTQNFTNEQAAKAAGYQPCSVCAAQARGKKKLPAGSELHGNPTSKILHGPSCKYYTAAGSSETFTSKEQAMKLGYRLCTVCNGK